MNEWLSQWIALPNIHPAVIHLPLGVLPLAFLSDLALLWRRTETWLDRMATTLYLVGAMGAGVAVWAGEQAQDSLVDIAPRMQPLIAEHSDWGHYVWYLFMALALARLFVAWRDRREGSVAQIPLRVILILVSLGGMTLLARASDMGGALVYRYGLAVERAQEKAAVEVPAPAIEAVPGDDAALRLTRESDGALVWRPIAADVAALGQVVQAIQGTSLDVISAASAGESAEGLPLTVEGRVILQLADGIGDVQVDAELELVSFDGTLGVAHHLGENEGGGFFVVKTTGAASLFDQRQGELEVLSEEITELPAGRFVLSVSSAGRHLKGMQDGKTVVHGHIPPDEPGGTGLLLEGSGVIWVHSVRVTPLESD
jgi:uncharacterized membrane protein